MYRDQHTRAPRAGGSAPAAPANPETPESDDVFGTPEAPATPAPTASRRRSAIVAALVATALWGVGGTVASVLFAHGAAPMEVVTVRTWVALAGLLLIAAVRRPPRPTGRRAITSVVGFGLAVAGSNAALFLAIGQLPVAVALVLQNLAPVFVVGWLTASARAVPRPGVLLGLLAALAGVALVVQLPTAGMSGVNATGVGMGLAAAAGVAVFSVLGGRAAHACGALGANTGAFVVAGSVWLAWQLPQGVPELCRQPALLAGSVGIGVLGTFTPFLLYAWASARLGPQTTAVIISLEPLFGALTARVWLGQTISLLQIGGGVVLLAAVVFLQSTGAVSGARGTAPLQGRTGEPRDGTDPLTTLRSDATGSSL